jgi:hypothetical protein
MHIGINRGMTLAGGNRARFGPDVFTSPIALGTPGYVTYDAPTDKWTVNRDASSGFVSVAQAGFKANTSYLFTFDFTREGTQASFAIDIRITTGTGGTGYFLNNAAAGPYSVTVTTGNAITAITFSMPSAGFSGAFANIVAREIL